jgi:hypothetical protein
MTVRAVDFREGDTVDEAAVNHSRSRSLEQRLNVAAVDRRGDVVRGSGFAAMGTSC